MKSSYRTSQGLTLIELLVVIAIIAILFALLLPLSKRPISSARRVRCMSNLNQLTMGVRMYSDDSNDASPSLGTTAASTNVFSLFSGYKELMKDYVGSRGKSSSKDKVFACPSDMFFPNFFTNGPPPMHYVPQSLHSTEFSSFSSYMFNGGDNVTHDFKTFQVKLPGLSGVKLSSVKNPNRTVLLCESSAAVPWSWHAPSPKMMFNNAQNIVSFVDGHVSYIKIYWNTNPYPGGTRSLAIQYDPPTDYEYQWSPD